MCLSFCNTYKCTVLSHDLVDSYFCCDNFATRNRTVCILLTRQQCYFGTDIVSIRTAAWQLLFTYLLLQTDQYFLFSDLFNKELPICADYYLYPARIFPRHVGLNEKS